MSTNEPPIDTEVAGEPDDKVRVAHFNVQTNNATHIQQLVLSLVDDGWEVETEWHDDGAWLTVYWRDRVADSDVEYGDLVSSGSTNANTGFTLSTNVNPGFDFGDLENVPLWEEAEDDSFVDG